MKKYSKGINLYKKASGIIPGGVQLLSKRPELFTRSMAKLLQTC